MDIDKKPHSAYLTPQTNMHFKFPPDICSSVDRFRDVSNFSVAPRLQSVRRSFTPIRSSLFVISPDISPIEFNFKRASPENVRKAAADSTVTDNHKITDSNDFVLMPPPLRYLQRSGSVAEMDARAHEKRTTTLYNFEKRLQKSSSQNKSSEFQYKGFEKNRLNSLISLSSQLQEAGLSRFIETFEKEEIDLAIFLSMNEEELKEIGIHSSIDRAAILKFKNELF